MIAYSFRTPQYGFTELSFQQALARARAREAVELAAARRGSPAEKPFPFRFRGKTGHVHPGDFVRFDNFGCHLDCVSDELRAVIQAARP